MVSREGIEAGLRRFFEAHPEGIAAAYLFGSVARGTHRPASDVDVAVLFETTPAPVLQGPRLRLEAELEALLKRPVQVVTLNDAPPDLVHRVLRDRCMLLDRDRSARIRFEVKARNEYFDLLPYLRRYRKLEPEHIP
jgi:predicted nucleotidyltransferase